MNEIEQVRSPGESSRSEEEPESDPAEADLEIAFELPSESRPIGEDSEDLLHLDAGEEEPLLELLRARDNAALRGRTLGKYELEKVLARGGQGVVVRARHAQLGNLIALKVFDPAGRAADLERFRAEAQLLVRLKHPNLPAVTDLGEEEGTSYIAMEYVQGQDLDHGTRDEMPSFRACARMLAPIAEALQYCHEMGVVHRDVKPGNILIEAETERPVLVDFGLAKRDVGAIEFASMEALLVSKSNEIKGSPEFMPPEQAEPDGSFGEIGPAADVHGLGGTLYFLLTGLPPFGGDTDRDALEDVLSREPTRPRKVNPEIPRPLDDLCLAALAKDSSERPTAAAFAEALQAFLAGGERPLVAVDPDSSFEHTTLPLEPDPMARSGKRKVRLRRGRAGAMAGAVSMDSVEELPAITLPPRQRRLGLRDAALIGELPVIPLAIGLVGTFVGSGFATASWGAWQGVSVFLLGVFALASFAVMWPAPNRARGSTPRRRAPIPKIAPRGDPDTHAARGNELLAQRDYAGAAGEYDALIRLRPQDAEALANRGVARFRLGDLGGALDDFDEAIRIRPDDGEAFANRGAARFKLNDLDGAIADFSEAIRLRPEDSESFANRGACFYKKKDYEHAITDFTAQIHLDPDDAKAYRRRGRAHFKQRDFEGAISDFSEVIRIRPDDADAYKKRGVAYFRAGDAKRAEADEERAKLLSKSKEE